MSELSRWTLQDAKNRFSAVVDAAEKGAPQLVTKRGRPAVVVLDIEEYERLRSEKRRSLVDHLLSIPRGEEGLPIVRDDWQDREIKL